MIGFISKLFGGNKSEKDIKSIMPRVEQVNQFVAAFASISNDDLRAKTSEFKQRIKDHLREMDTSIADLGKRAEELPFSDISGKDTIYIEIDELKKKRDDLIEEVLESILPEAFAVVKETARRFKENTQIITTANDRDRVLSVTKDYVKIEGDHAIYSNSWTAAGGAITWNMVHYDMMARSQKWLPVREKPWFPPCPPI
jgi:preprotein translocase subunit SecA